jgi:hypothetical protein
LIRSLNAGSCDLLLQSAGLLMRLWDSVPQLPGSDFIRPSFSVLNSRRCTFKREKRKVNDLLAREKTDPGKCIK